MLKIRRAADADFPLVWPIFKLVIAAGDTYVYREPISQAQAQAVWMPPDGMTYVAEDGGLIAGTYMLRPNQSGRGSHVANAGYMVHPDSRGRGIGRAMCWHSLREAKERGFAAMQFNFVVSSNLDAIALWRSCGFAVVGTVPKAFDHATLGLVDVLVMHRMLDDVTPPQT